MSQHSEVLFTRLVVGCLLVCLLETGAWTQNQATYFTYRMQQLKQELNIAGTQERQVRSIVEQETAELMEIACNPATSREYKLNKFRDILKGSESSMKPLLSTAQYQRLVELRQQMLQELKKREPAHSCTKAYWGNH